VSLWQNEEKKQKKDLQKKELKKQLECVQQQDVVHGVNGLYW